MVPLFLSLRLNGLYSWTPPADDLPNHIYTETDLFKGRKRYPYQFYRTPSRQKSAYNIFWVPSFSNMPKRLYFSAIYFLYTF